jgi:hypothetical protein
MKVSLRLVMIHEDERSGQSIEMLAQQEIAYCELTSAESAQQVMATLASAAKAVIRPIIGGEGEEEL